MSIEPAASSEPGAADGEGREPIAAIAQQIEDQLERGRESREVLALSADQEEQLAAFFAAQSKTATLLSEEIRPVQMRTGQVASTLGMLKDDPDMPSGLRRSFARLTDPEAEQVLYDMSIGEASLQSLAIRADQQAGQLLRGEGGFTKADVRRAIEAQEALDSAHAFFEARNQLIAELLAGVPFLRLKQALAHQGKAERRRTFAALFEIPLEATFDARSDQMDELFLALDRIHPAYPLVDPEDREITAEMLASYRPPGLSGGRTAQDEEDDREAMRLIGGYASRHSTLSARSSRIDRGLTEGRLAIETVFVPLLAE